MEYNYNDTSSNDRFSRYIDRMKSKIMPSYDDDDEHDIDPSKFEIRTTTIACGGQRINQVNNSILKKKSV